MNTRCSKHVEATKNLIKSLISNMHFVGLLTYSMVQSPSWEADWFAASQEIHRISRNPKVHYRTHKPPPPVPILGQPNPVHIPTSHLLEIIPNITYPSTPRSPQWSLSLRFPHQDPIRPPLLTHTRHMPSPSHFVYVTQLYHNARYKTPYISWSLCSLPKGELFVGPRCVFLTSKKTLLCTLNA